MKRKSRAEFRKGVDTVTWGFIEQVVLRVFRKMREDGHKSWRGIQLLGLLLLMVGTSLAFEVIKRETINTLWGDKRREVHRSCLSGPL